MLAEMKNVTRPAVMGLSHYSGVVQIYDVMIAKNSKVEQH